MPVTDVSHDLDARTLTIVADFAGSPKRIWEVYADPRQLERIWGPPTYPPPSSITTWSPAVG